MRRAAWWFVMLGALASTASAQEAWRPPEDLGIRVAALPRPHECRVWQPGLNEAKQRRSGPCDKAWAQAPAGSWILDRTDRDHVRVYVVGAEGGRRVTGVAVYDALRGDLLRELPS